MPLFDFKCMDCQHIWEQLIKNKDKKIICPKCDSKNIEKMVSNFSIKFKGKGFYETDYKNK